MDRPYESCEEFYAREEEYWDREFDEDSDDEYDAIKDWGLMTDQTYESVARQRQAGTLGRRR